MGTKKPQLLEQQADVVASATEHGMQSVTKRPFERVSVKSAVHLHVTDDRFNGTASFDHCVQGSCDAALLARS